MKKNATVLEETGKIVDETTETLSRTIMDTEKRIDRAVEPVREEVFRRFPVLFILLVAFGITATITGMEELLLQVGILKSNPVLLLIIGLSLLIFTGRLYKKLG